jgi:hypothetical protein
MAQQTWEVYTGATAAGSTTIPNTKDALEALQSGNSGATEPTYKVLGTIWEDTTTGLRKIYNGSAWIVAPSNGFSALPADDTTPSVLGGGVFEEVYTTATTVTALDDGVKGDKVTIMFTTSNMTIDGALTHTGMTIPCIAGDIMEWTHNGTTFKQTGGSVGMGQFVNVSANAIGDWIASTVTTFTNVDVSDDGVRKGASAVVVSVLMSATVGVPDLRAGNTGVGDDPCKIAAAATILAQGLIPLDNSATFDAKFSISWTTATNEAEVVGYYI